jgi:D-alanyl-D-alanine carboxypeptidase
MEKGMAAQGLDLVETGSVLLTATVSRREVLHKAAGFGAVAAAVSLGLSVRGGSALADDTGFYRTTSSLNLRTGPGLRRRVILVIPSDTGVESLGKSKNGYRYVAYHGVAGWAHGDYLEATDDIEVPMVTGTAQTTTGVNMRNQPSTSASVYRVLPEGTTVDVFDVWENGYRMVGHAQVTGWIYADYLDAGGGPLGGYVVTTIALNLREEANTSSRVLTVMPKGAKAFRGDVIANGFLGVTYNGKSGWAHMDYLESI